MLPQTGALLRRESFVMLSGIFRPYLTSNPLNTASWRISLNICSCTLPRTMSLQLHSKIILSPSTTFGWNEIGVSVCVCVLCGIVDGHIDRRARPALLSSTTFVGWILGEETKTVILLQNNSGYTVMCTVTCILLSDQLNFTIILWRESLSLFVIK